VRVLLLAGLLAAGAQAAGYRIAGTVLNAVSRQPVSGAHVTIAPFERPDERLPFVTGQDGRFVFAGMPAGTYELIVQHRGFLAAEFANPLVAGPDLHTDALVISLSPPAVIAGKVTDDAGDPVYQANVQLFNSSIQNGRRRVTAVSTKQTADNGEYRFGGLAAGTYYVAVSGYPWYAKFNETHGDTLPRGMAHTGYGIQYFRSASDAAAAEPIVLRPGQEANADFALVPLPAVSVHVHVEGGDDSRKQYTLTAAGPGGNPVLVRQGSEAGDLYNFWGVSPGHYVLEVRGGLYTREPIDAGAVDADINVRLTEAPSLSGTIELEGGGSPPPGASVVLSDADTGAIHAASIGTGGRFSIQGIPPEHYHVALNGAGDYYLKRWSAEGVTAERLKLIAAKGASVIGKVQRDGQAFPGALVVLASSEDCRATESASDGSYELRGVPPGSYALFAVEDGADLEYANPAAIGPYLKSARKIKMAAAGSYSQTLELPAATADRPAPASPKP
jgi:uncharacterized protein (DUF2141 family)